jgi:predicted RNA-binding protein with RPS1 domain
LQLQSAKGRANCYTGHVKAVQPYGAFVRFGDQEHTAVRDGLLHVSGQASAELSARVKQLRAGEQVRVWVKQIYIGQGKIGLCLC